MRAYGDREGDGMVQMSFVLALPPSPRAREAAKKFAEAHGLADPIVATMEEAAQGHSYFVVYGRSSHDVDVTTLEVPELRTEALPLKSAVCGFSFSLVGHRTTITFEEDRHYREK